MNRDSVLPARHVLRLVLAAAALAVAGPAAHAQLASIACVNGPTNSSYGQYYVCTAGGALYGDSLSYAQQLGPHGLSAASAGNYRFGQAPYSSATEANLATGKLKSIISFGPDANAYELDARAEMGDLLTFHGSGTAWLTTRITGSFIGAANNNWWNSFNYMLSAWGVTGGEFDGRDMTANIDIMFRNASGVTAPTGNCSSTRWSLGITSCTVVSNDPTNVIIDLMLQIPNLTDGDQIYFSAAGVAGANSAANGTVDFSHTATLGLTTDPGLTWDSQSGEFLTQDDVTTAPEPSSIALLASGLAAVVIARRRRRPMR